MWKRAYEALKRGGIAVFSPAQKQGKCNAPYVVLSDAGQTAGHSPKTARAYLEAAVHVPLGRYSMLDTVKKQVAAALRAEHLSRTGEEAAVSIDADIGAVVLRMEFAGIKRNC